MIRVTRRYRFSASHRLHSPRMGDGENRRLYGKCNNPYGHGHNYVLDVTACGPVDPASGRAIDLARLDELVRAQVLVPFDRRNLNEEVEAFRKAVPTSENLGLEISRRLRRNWTSVFDGEWPRLSGVRIAETPRNIFQISEHEVE
jgi:6-pyruvoyltetrahydropterin/6-carboxytetrahydropterin synthase